MQGMPLEVGTGQCPPHIHPGLLLCPEVGTGLLCYSLLFDLSHRTLVLGSAEEADVRILSHCGVGGVGSSGVLGAQAAPPGAVSHSGVASRTGGCPWAEITPGATWAASPAPKTPSVPHLLPETLIFLMVLVELLVTWTLTLRGSPW